MKVSAITITWKLGYIDSLVACLKDQTLKDIEWLLIDELYWLRKDAVKDYIGDAFQFKHMPPSEILPYASSAIAFNTGLVRAQGELVYFMIDHIYLHPRVLERHWEIYQKYGPKAMVSGPCLDGINSTGKSCFETGPQNRLVIIGSQPVIYPEHSPPVPWPLKPDFQEFKPENYISIYKESFVPTWASVPLDWRTGQIANIPMENGLYESTSGPNWWWAGRSDSAPLEALLEVNGFDETHVGIHGGPDAELSARLMAKGMRHLVDATIPVIILPHPIRKKEVSGAPTRIQPDLKALRALGPAYQNEMLAKSLAGFLNEYKLMLDRKEGELNRDKTTYRTLAKELEERRRGMKRVDAKCNATGN